MKFRTICWGSNLILPLTWSRLDRQQLKQACRKKFLSRTSSMCIFVTTELSAQIRRVQQDDDFIKAVIEMFKQRPYQDCKLKGGLLYKVVDGNELLAALKLIEREVIQRSHEDVLSWAKKVAIFTA
nr:uncharacterized protein LOC116652356 [Drosophila virilis]